MTQNISLGNGVNAFFENKNAILKSLSRSKNQSQITNSQCKTQQFSEDYTKLKNNMFSIIGDKSPTNVEDFKNLISVALFSNSYDINSADEFCIKENSDFENFINSINFEKEFQDYMESRGCKSENELKSLNEVGFNSVEELKNAVERTIKILEINIESTGYKTDAIKDNISAILDNASIEDLNNFLKNSKDTSYVMQVTALEFLAESALDDEDVFLAFKNSMDEFLQRMIEGKSGEEEVEKALKKYMFKLHEDGEKPNETEPKSEEGEEEDHSKDSINDIIRRRSANEAYKNEKLNAIADTGKSTSNLQTAIATK